MLQYDQRKMKGENLETTANGGNKMYYSSGNYEAFARPKKPAGVDRKSAYLVGTGLAALTAACYLVRDGQMKGEHIHLFEKGSIPGGACDGCQYPGIGYVMRGGREMDDHFEVMWDLFRSIPSLETEGASVLDEYYWLNKADPNYSLCRATENRGQNAHTDGKFGLSDQGCMELIKLFFTPDEQLYDKRITDVFDAEVFSSNFWLYWRTMFAFENWHSALEMKLYLKRYIHHVGGLPDLRALRFTRYNQYESMILPMIRYLEGHGVRFHYNTKVTNIEFELTGGKKQARTICLLVDDEAERVDLTENDLVFITNGGCVESTSIGSQDQPAVFNPTLRPGNGWDLWKKIAAQDEAFGRPEKFCSDPEQTNWMSATVTTLDERIVPYIQNICQRQIFSIQLYASYSQIIQLCKVIGENQRIIFSILTSITTIIIVLQRVSNRTLSNGNRTADILSELSIAKAECVLRSRCRCGLRRAAFRCCSCCVGDVTSLAFLYGNRNLECLCFSNC